MKVASRARGEHFVKGTIRWGIGRKRKKISPRSVSLWGIVKIKKTIREKEWKGNQKKEFWAKKKNSLADLGQTNHLGNNRKTREKGRRVFRVGLDPEQLEREDPEKESNRGTRHDRLTYRGGRIGKSKKIKGEKNDSDPGTSTKETSKKRGKKKGKRRGYNSSADLFGRREKGENDKVKSNGGKEVRIHKCKQRP